MSFQVKEPVLVIGLGGAGSRLAEEAGRALNSDCLMISNDERDLASDAESIHVRTGPVINPSVQMIRGSTYGVSEEIRAKIGGYGTIIMMGNLAGRAGSAMAPVISEICRDSEAGLVSFAIMPFRYEKDRIFSSGVALKRVRENSECTIVLDNDALLEGNPDLTSKSCYTIANSAIIHVVKSLGTSHIEGQTSILSASKKGLDMEDSLRDSLKMLYGDAPPNSVKGSILYVAGGSNVPVGVLNSIAGIAGRVAGSSSQVDVAGDESSTVMLSSVQGMTKFDSYDPLGIIPQENTLDWSTPDCSIDCELDLYQME